MSYGIKLDGIDQWRGVLEGFSDRRIRAVQATALTRTARDIEGEWLGDIFAAIDRPTGATARAVSVKQATARDMVAEVFIKDRPVRADAPAPVDWLAPQEEGGQRYLKKFERALIAQGSMPAGHKVVPGPFATLDGYGNISRSQIVQVITQLGAAFSPGYQRVISSTLGKRLATAKRHGREYVAINKRQRGGLALGIYQRDGRALLPVFMFVSVVTYRKTLDLQQTARSLGPTRVVSQIERAIGEHITRLTAAGRLPATT
jgi:hypothetical protein